MPGNSLPTFFCITLLLAAAQVCANPVPDEVGREFNSLPERVAREHDPKDREKLTDCFGRYGIDLLRSDALASLDRHFVALKATMIESQRPGHAVQTKLQAWFRKRASQDDRKAMCIALREWLTSPPTEAPPEGGMQIMGPPKAVRLRILREQIQAGEELASYGDLEALPALRSLEIPHFQAGETWASSYEPLQVSLSQAILRLEHPASAGFLVAEADGKLRCAATLADIDSVHINYYEGPQSGLPVNGDVVARIMTLLPTSRSDSPSGWVGSHDVLTIYLHNGLVAKLNLTEEHRFVYSDNSRVREWDTHITIRNAALYDAVVALFPQGHAR